MSVKEGTNYQVHKRTLGVGGGVPHLDCYGGHMNVFTAAKAKL